MYFVSQSQSWAVVLDLIFRYELQLLQSWQRVPEVAHLMASKKQREQAR